jgi:hypothetical protein
MPDPVIVVRATALLRRLASSESGLAFMEFAYALPFLLVTLLGGLELVHLALTHQQLSRVATSTADLAARFRSSIDETDVNTLFLGSRMSATIDDFDENGRIILSSVTRNPNDDGHWIRWQRCEGNAAVADSEIGETGDGELDTSIADVNGMVITKPNNVLVAEVTYSYTPWFFPITSPILAKIAPVFVPRDISYTSAFIARELTLNDITNTTGLGAGAIATC